MSEATTVKRCMFCGIDVAKAPRLKDAQGRYACKPCAEQKATASKGGGAPRAAAAPAPSANYDDDALDLAAIAQMVPAGTVQTARQCPSCGAVVSNDAVICMSCGFNVSTGKGAKTRIEKAVGDRTGGGKRRRALGINLSAEMFSLIVMGLLAVLFGLSFVNPVFALAYALVTLLYSLAYYVLLVVTPFQEGESGWGICVLLSLLVPFCAVGVLYYIFAVSSSAALKVMFLAQIIAVVGLFILRANLAMP